GIMYGYSQNYNMTTATTIATCSVTFYDCGGAIGSYGNAESMIYTIFPPRETSSIQIAFIEMNLENNVFILYVYDGDQIGAPLLYTFTGTEIPTVFQATGNNPSGCLTFRFTSDTYNNAPGWAATISCAQVCQPINAVLASSTPTAINNV